MNINRNVDQDNIKNNLKTRTIFSGKPDSSKFYSFDFVYVLDYKKSSPSEVEEAIQAGAQFITDDRFQLDRRGNTTDNRVAKLLKERGYVEDPSYSPLITIWYPKIE